ncbi:hypothetical protein MP228_002131 [Amoeboaphelidium protococcarum]|nr:hypothetical protein MP228_002131 [Amoeboaphelidium protococcarum]
MKRVLLLWLYLMSVVLAFNCTRDGCANAGQCRSDDGSCQCLSGLSGDDCSEILCGSLYNSSRPTLKSLGGKSCSCDAGWSGPNCQVCVSDRACQNAPIQMCTSNQNAWMRKNYFCKTNSELIKLAIGVSPDMSADCDVTAQTCNAIIWLNNKVQFACSMTQCSQLVGKDSATWTCQQSKCVCEDNATLCKGPLPIKSTLELIKGPTVIKCTDDKKCSLKDPAIDQFFPEGIPSDNCKYGECGVYVPNNTGQLNTGDSAALAVGLFVGCLVLGGLAFCLYQKRMLTNRPLQDLRRISTFEFQKIGYEIVQNGASKQLLHGVSGAFKAGDLVAVMGASGAGKSTLLDILAGIKKSGRISGRIFIDGVEINSRSKSILPISGYVDQQDQFINSTTVREAVEFAAMCRLPDSMPRKQKMKKVYDILNQLDLLKIQHTVVGHGDFRRISGGEARRLSIALELINSPSILFLDEITSGLDSKTAFSVIQYVQRLCKSQGIIAVVNIHQPRSDLFNLFDKVMIMSHGCSAYCDKLGELPQFFDNLKFPCPEGYSMADHIIDYAYELRKASEVYDSRDSVDTTNSIPRSESLRLIISEEQAAPLQDAVNDTPEIRTSSLTQFTEVFHRAIRQMIRNPWLLVLQFGIAIVGQIVLGAIFFDVGYSLASAQNRFGSLFFNLVFNAFASMSTLASFSSERPVFLREKSRGYYTGAVYFTVKILTDIVPYRLLPTLVSVPISYFMIGYVNTAEAFSRYLLIMCCFSVLMGTFCLLVGILIPRPGSANVVASSCILFFMLFGGLLINIRNMRSFIGWLQYLSLIRFSFEALAVNEGALITFTDNLAGSNVVLPGVVVVSTFFGLDVTAYSRDAIILMCQTLVMITLVLLIGHFKLKEVK